MVSVSAGAGDNDKLVTQGYVDDTTNGGGEVVLDKLTTVSTSGTSEQTQKINVNYNFNKHISLEGLYEVRDTTIENRLTEPESLGVDFKFMMDFE